MQKYNCLYIHGLDSSPLKEKLDILKASGMNVFALHIDYRNQKNSYDLLENFAKKNEINFIVDSSLGGYIDAYPKSKTIERIFECHWLAHGIDLNTFKEFTVLSVQILEHNLVNIGI